MHEQKTHGLHAVGRVSGRSYDSQQKDAINVIIFVTLMGHAE